MDITSLDNKRVKDWKKLSERKYREEMNLFMIEGEHLVSEALKAGCLVEVIATEEVDIDTQVTYVTPEIMKYLSSLITPPKIMGICKINLNDKICGNKILILDNIQDPGNLGTIIRSAVAFDIDTIVLGDGTVDLYNSKVLRATQGLIFHINIIKGNSSDIITELKNENYQIIGTSVVDGHELKSFNTKNKYALIMGNEGHGMSDNLNNKCDDFIYIKMNDKAESLNVSVACSIILYQLDK